MVVAIAQKSPSASVLRTPIQNIYRSEQETYQTAFCRFAENPSRLAIRRAFQPMSSETAPDSSPRSDTPELKAPPKAFLQWARQSRLKSFIPVSTKRRLLNIIEAPPAPGHRFLGTAVRIFARPHRCLAALVRQVESSPLASRIDAVTRQPRRHHSSRSSCFAVTARPIFAAPSTASSTVRSGISGGRGAGDGAST